MPGQTGQRTVTRHVIDQVTTLALAKTDWFTASDVRPPGLPTNTVVRVLRRFVESGDIVRVSENGNARYRWVNT